MLIIWPIPVPLFALSPRYVYQYHDDVGLASFTPAVRTQSRILVYYWKTWPTCILITIIVIDLIISYENVDVKHEG